MQQIVYQGKVLWDKVTLADHFFSRFKGLMGKKQLLADEGLSISPCSQVHTYFMRFPIDVLSVAADFRIVHIETLSPRKIGKKVKEAAFVLEVAAGSAEQFGLVTGDVISIQTIGGKAK